MINSSETKSCNRNELDNTSAERLRGGGVSDDSDSSARDARDPRSKAELRLSNVFKKIEAIESKIKFLLRKVSAANENKPGGPSEEKTMSMLQKEIKKYQKKLEKCQQKKKRYEREPRLMSYKHKANRSEDTSNSNAEHDAMSKNVVVANPSQSTNASKKQSKVSQPAAELTEAQGSDNILAIAKFKQRAAGQDDEDLRFAEGSSNTSFGIVKQSNTNFDEDLMCQKMHQAAFKKFRLQNMYFIYTRYLTKEFYKSGLFQYFPITTDGQPVAEVRLNLPLGAYNHQAGPQREVRFKRMDPLHKCAMVYYTYRSSQQLVDRIISEAWTQFYPKRFYMSFDHCVDISVKDLPENRRKPRRRAQNRIDANPGHFKCLIFRPIAIQIPKGMKLAYGLGHPYAQEHRFGEQDFTNTEWFQLQVRYKWGNDPIWGYFQQKVIDENYQHNFWIFGLRHWIGWEQIKWAFCDVLLPRERGHWNVRRSPDAMYAGYKCQGFNVKQLEKLKAENQEFRENYEAWGKVHSDWDIPSKRRS